MLQRLVGYLVIAWGALVLRLPFTRPRLGDAAFYAFRKRWNAAIGRWLQIRYEPHGPMPGPGTLVVANHSGFADINGLMSTLPAEARPHFISKIEVGRIPVFGWHMRHYGDILLDRQDPTARRRVLTQALELLGRGHSVVVFPEGTRSKDGRPASVIHTGLIEAALKFGHAVQPVAIVGTRGLIEKPRSRSPGWAVVPIRFGEPRPTYESANAVWREVLTLWEGAHT